MSARSVVVTAGAAGIGRAIARAFLAEGDRVHVVDVDGGAIRTLQSEIPEISATEGDVTDEALVERVISGRVEETGGIDVMVNCAGIAGPAALAEDVSLEDWRRCLGVNLDAAFLFAKHVIPNMRNRGSGCIINISSTAGWHGYPMRSPYASAKWAVNGLTKSLAMELGPVGIRVNAICPGSINGDRMDRVIAAEAKNKGVSAQEIRDAYTRGCSMRTFIDAEDIADMAIFLASDKAARVTGQILNVDGHLENPGGLDE